MIKITLLRNLNCNFSCKTSKYARNFSSSSGFSEIVMKVLSNYKSTKVKNVFVLEKITKYDLEIQNGLSPSQIYKTFPLAYNTHLKHKKIMKSLIYHLKNVYNLETQVVKAQSKELLPFEGSKNTERIRPDLLIAAGGDGTFLEGASLIPADQLSDKPIWLAGLNTDPERSMGTLCMSYFGPKNEQHFNCGYYDYEKCQPTSKESSIPSKSDSPDPSYDSSIFYKNLKEFCSYSYNRTSEKRLHFDDPSLYYSEDNSQIPVKGDDVLITYDQYVRVLLDNLLNFNLHPIPRQRLRFKLFKRKMLNFNRLKSDETNETSTNCFDNSVIEKILVRNASSSFEEKELINDYHPSNTDSYSLPYGIVNDVMITGEDFGKSFYSIVQVDDRPLKRVKSSGILITSGTGSTAWAYNISKINFFKGTSLIKCLLEHPDVPKSLEKAISNQIYIYDEIIKESIDCFNHKLKMDPSSSVMRCLIREEISNKTTDETSFYSCKQVKVVPLCKNAVACADGSTRVKLDYGDVALIKTFERDLIWSLI
uniref:NAD(+) kinase n=1 Tax=Theileria annulata TaxID=5874 RepID=A0A3B0MYQ6_THEAN